MNPKPETAALLEAKDMWAGFRPKTRRGWRSKEVMWALSSVDMALMPGEMLGVIGPNGSGKSTLLQCLAGVVKPSRGTLITRGSVAALVVLTAGFHRELSGKENALIVGVMSGLTRAEVRRRYDAIQEFSSLDDEIMDSPMFTYSLGMWLRLGFALLIHSDPRILLVDEVLAVGDEEFQLKCLGKIRQMQEQGCGVVLVSHDLDLVEEKCGRTMLLEHGAVRFTGPTLDVMKIYREMPSSSVSRG
jgi:ABC-type polysaccharide/polyol phosphate transport system ATPase subunit